MSFHFVAKLPSPDEIREQFPVPEHLTQIKHRRDAEIRDVITGKSNKFLVIIGPCSADNEDAVCDYVSRLARINEKVHDFMESTLLSSLYILDISPLSDLR